MKSKASRRWKVFVAIGCALLIAALALIIHNAVESANAEKYSKGALEKFAQIVTERHPYIFSSSSQDISWEEYLASGGETEKTDPIVMIDGYYYIGMLEIPSLELELPVLADWDYSKLAMSPCRFSGAAVTDDLVICAHNYKSHFGPLRWIKFDSDVYLTDVDGNIHHYIVDNIETLPPENIEEMITAETSEGDDIWDLTLFTCTPGGSSRMAVRCVRVLDY